MVDKLDIFVEAVGSKPVTVTVEIDLGLSPQAKDINVEALVRGATNEAYKATEDYLRNIK